MPIKDNLFNFSPKNSLPTKTKVNILMEFKVGNKIVDGITVKKYIKNKFTAFCVTAATKTNT